MNNIKRMSTIQQIECMHIEHRVEGLSESFVFKPAIYATYGAARKAMSALVTEEITQSDKEIAARWSLLSGILAADEQARIDAFHNSHISSLNSSSIDETTSPHYSKVSNEIIYDGTINSKILSVNIVARANSSGDSFSARLFDVTNSKIVAEKTGLTNSNIVITGLGEILYQPETKTVLELQIKRDSGEDVIISESFEIKFI